MSERTKKVLKIITNVLLVLLFVVASLALVKNLMYEEVIVSGSSMNDTLVDGNFGFIETTSWARNSISRFQIITFKYQDYTNDKERLLVKRVIGLPNETMRIDPQTGDLYINEIKTEQSFLSEVNKRLTYSYEYRGSELFLEGLKLDDGEYFVMGDNRGNSMDSRGAVGIVKSDQITGVLKVIFGKCEIDLENKTCRSGTKEYRSWMFF